MLNKLIGLVIRWMGLQCLELRDWRTDHVYAVCTLYPEEADAVLRQPMIGDLIWVRSEQF